MPCKTKISSVQLKHDEMETTNCFAREEKRKKKKRKKEEEKEEDMRPLQLNTVRNVCNHRWRGYIPKTLPRGHDHVQPPQSLLRDRLMPLLLQHLEHLVVVTRRWVVGSHSSHQHIPWTVIEIR